MIRYHKPFLLFLVNPETVALPAGAPGESFTFCNPSTYSHGIFSNNLADNASCAVGPCHLFLPRSLRSRSLLRCRLFRTPIQTKSMASTGRVGIRCGKSLGGGRWWANQTCTEMLWLILLQQRSKEGVRRSGMVLGLFDRDGYVIQLAGF